MVWMTLSAIGAGKGMRFITMWANPRSRYFIHIRVIVARSAILAVHIVIIVARSMLALALLAHHSIAC
jgi:hypothetical protein